MKKATYCNKEEFLQVIYLHTAYTLTNYVADNTQDKEWHRKLATAATLLLKVYNERIACLDPIQKGKVDTRANHSFVRVVSTDEKAIEKMQQETETITLEFEDFLDIVEFSNWSCLKCSQGDYVQKCPFRKLLHKYNLPAARIEPVPGECEFRWDNEIRSMPPEGMPTLANGERMERDLRHEGTRTMDPEDDRNARGHEMREKSGSNRPKVQANIPKNNKRKKH